MPDVASPSPPRHRTLCTSLMVVLTVCFALQQLIIVHFAKPYDAYFALNGYGMKSGQLWQIFTYQFFHVGYIHFFLNLAGIWFLGRSVESELGTKRFGRLYQGGVILGAILQGLVGLAGFWLPESMESVASLLRDRFGGPVMGASVGLCASIAAYCQLHPHSKLFPLIPWLTGAHWRWIILGLTLALVFVPTNPDLPHLAHLGAFLTGLCFVRAPKNSAV